MGIKLVWVVFGVLVGLFIIAISPLKELLHLSGDFRSFVLPLGIVGVLLVALAARAKSGAVLKSFLIITGASAAGWPLSLYLHDFLYRFFPAEPVTYILVFFVLPVTFIGGAAGAITIGFKRLLSSH